MHRRSWPRTAALAVLLATVLFPSGSAAAGDMTDDFGAVLGGDREVFEAKYGKPIGAVSADGSATGATYRVPGYASVMVSWQEGRSDQIVLTAGDGWSQAKARELARRFYPNDVAFSSNQSSISSINGRTTGQILQTGHSDALAGRFSAATYRQAGVSGRPGDLRVGMILNRSNGVATIDIAIGTSWSPR